MSYPEQAEEVDRQMLFDELEIGQIVVNGNAGIIDEDIKRTDPLRSLLDLRSVGHVQGYRCHALIGDFECAASSRIDLLGTPSKSLIHERPPDAAAGARDRKSTRLNSSHVAISYAVFCLKKKK